jgi:hypothetical protein
MADDDEPAAQALLERISASRGRNDKSEKAGRMSE